MQTFPTFYAKRHPYSKRYSPLNKADVTAKWYASVNSPGDDEVIVMIDPDNWLLKPVDAIAAQIRPGHAVAEGAWFEGQKGLVREVRFSRTDSLHCLRSAMPEPTHGAPRTSRAPTACIECAPLRHSPSVAPRSPHQRRAVC
jgi:hypothetical protein